MAYTKGVYVPSTTSGKYYIFVSKDGIVEYYDDPSRAPSDSIFKGSNTYTPTDKFSHIQIALDTTTSNSNHPIIELTSGEDNHPIIKLYEEGTTPTTISSFWIFQGTFSFNFIDCVLPEDWTYGPGITSGCVGFTTFPENATYVKLVPTSGYQISYSVGGVPKGFAASIYFKTSERYYRRHSGQFYTVGEAEASWVSWAGCELSLGSHKTVGWGYPDTPLHDNMSHNVYFKLYWK